MNSQPNHEFSMEDEPVRATNGMVLNFRENSFYRPEANGSPVYGSGKLKLPSMTIFLFSVPSMTLSLDLKLTPS